MVWPTKQDFGQVRQFTLDNLYSNHEKFLENPNKFKQFHAKSEWVLGYAIPPFQRPVVWEEERMIKFIESAVVGLNLGTYTYNSTMNLCNETKDEDGNEIWPYDRWLVDGQQRLTSLERFWNNEFPVYGLFWEEVEKNVQRRFLYTGFPAYETQLDSENSLRELYDLMNFGGVAHTQDQRATLSF